MNRQSFRDVVKGEYGREVAYVNTETVNENNVLDIISKTYACFLRNRRVAEYLWNYKKGDQPVHYRTKTVREDVNNPVVENHAWEIVRFKNGQSNGEPIQCVSTKKEENVNKYVEKFNSYCDASGKHAKDISSGEWTSAVGTGFKAVQFTRKKDVPFRIIVPTPMNTYVVYSSITEEPILAVQTLKDENDYTYLFAYSETMQFKIVNHKIVEAGLHAFGGIPIVEYPNNQDRVSDIELVIDILDAINNMQSNRMDAIEQFVQSWIKFVNCDIDEETFQKMKMNGALVVKSNNGVENKADVDIMTQELNQSESQVAKNDLWDNVLSILAIPNKEGNTGGDTAGAVSLRNGWDHSKQAAKLKDAYTIESERRLNRVILNVIRIEKGDTDCPLSEMDYKVQVSHSPTDNLQVKVQSLQMLLQMGIHPLVAIKTCGLWTDAEKVFLLSKSYLDNIYKTIEDAEEQEARANELLAKMNNKGDGATTE